MELDCSLLLQLGSWLSLRERIIHSIRLCLKQNPNSIQVNVMNTEMGTVDGTHECNKRISWQSY